MIWAWKVALRRRWVLGFAMRVSNLDFGGLRLLVFAGDCLRLQVRVCIFCTPRRVSGLLFWSQAFPGRFNFSYRVFLVFLLLRCGGFGGGGYCHCICVLPPTRSVSFLLRSRQILLNHCRFPHMLRLEREAFYDVASVGQPASRHEYLGMMNFPSPKKTVNVTVNRSRLARVLARNQSLKRSRTLHIVAGSSRVTRSADISSGDRA